MCGVIAGLITTGVGVVLLIAVFVLNFNVIPNIITTTINEKTVLITDSEQWERFEETPFPLRLSVYFFNITNPEEVLTGGVPVVDELEPYHYKLYMKRNIENVSDDTVVYRRQEFLEFDAEASFPRTEQDEVTIANIPYLAILQTAEMSFPGLMSVLNLATANIFGNDKNSPIATYKVDDLLLNGYKLCEQPGLIGAIPCTQIRNIGADSKNMEILDDGTILFSLIRYKQEKESEVYEISRGLNEPADLARIHRFAGFPALQYWPETAGGPVPNLAGTGLCNEIKGTDSFMYNPFVDKKESLYALNTDICRSVELVYVGESSYSGIPSYLFATDERFLDNENGCFCVNQTKGVTREDGCLFKGAAELISCTDKEMDLTSVITETEVLTILSSGSVTHCLIIALSMNNVMGLDTTYHQVAPLLVC